MSYQTNLTDSQRDFIHVNCKEILTTKSKIDVWEVINAIFYLVKTGCQWRMLPSNFPHWRTCYEFFRKWTSIGIMDALLDKLVVMKSTDEVETGEVIIDSQSVKSAHPSSQKGIDGGKRIKGIKRHIAVNSTGLPLTISITTANKHDSKAAYSLIGRIGGKLHAINTIKADMGYRGVLSDVLKSSFGVKLQCVKSNFGTSEFRPIDGRWVVERTFAWLDTFRRLCRNYEQQLLTARHMTVTALVMLLLRYV